jgi:hypothetical protein
MSERGGEESERYATLLDWGTRVGLALLVLSFFTYVLGFVSPLVPLEQLPRLWNLPVKTYLEQSGMPTGWGWLAMAGKGDLANLVGIGILAGCSLPPLLGLIPIYIRRRDFVYAGICALVVLVLVLAASGVLTGGH